MRYRFSIFSTYDVTLIKYFSYTTHASAQAGLEVAADIRDGDASMVMSAINQVLRFMVELNFGEVPMLSWERWAQETIDETQAKCDLMSIPIQF